MLQLIQQLIENKTVLAAVAGALVGSIVSYILTIITDRRKQRKQERYAIVTELTLFGHNYMAALQELQAAQEAGKQIAVWSCLAQITRLEGNLVAVQMRLWSVFPERPVRAALARLLSRAATTMHYISSITRNKNEADIAIRWFGSGLEEVTLQAAKVTRLPTRDPERLVWVGFRKMTAQDKRLLSFEDEPPPWEFSIVFDFHKKVDGADLIEIREKLESRAGNLQCVKHHRHAHLFLNGKDTTSYETQIEACCKDFAIKVAKALKLDAAKLKVLKSP